MPSLDSARVARIRGILHDLAHVIAHGIAGFILFGVVRFLVRMLGRLFENRDVELAGQTQLIVDLQALARTYWYLLPLLLVVDFVLMRFGRRNSADHRTAAGYSTGVMLVLMLSLGFATVVLVHPLAVLVKPAQ